jgi:hypothetical protein
VEILHPVVINSLHTETVSDFPSVTIIIIIIIIIKYVIVAFLVGAVFQDHVLVLLNVSVVYINAVSQVFSSYTEDVKQRR